MNLLIGLTLLAFLYIPAVSHNVMVAGARDALLEWQMSALKGATSGRNVAWIYVDDATRAEWGFTPFIPRRRLAELLAFALRGKPAATIVDYDLSWTQNATDDARLSDVLRGHQQHCGGGCAPVILLRGFAPNMALNAVAAQPSFLDAPLGTSRARPYAGRGVFWGSADMLLDEDGAVRRWRLWVDSCLRPGPAQPFASVTLLGAAAATRTPYANVRAALLPMTSACGSTQSSQRTTPNRSLRLGTNVLALSGDEIEQRVFYSIAPDRRAYSLPADQLAMQPANAGADQFVMLSAADIVGHPEARADLLRGRVVVIGGASLRDDVHPTPLGLMPGSLVLINAVDTLLGRQIRTVGIWYTVLLEVLLITVVSLLFAALTPPAATALSLLAIGVCILTLGMALFDTGVWLDFVMPTLGVLGHEIIHAAHRRIESLRHDPFKHERRRGEA